MEIRKFFVGDVVQMRKVHPCGSDRWEVLRVGIDFRLRCLGCGRVIMLPRPRFERSVRKVVSSVHPLLGAAEKGGAARGAAAAEKAGEGGAL
ncbi:MAG: DUF951 domain-containing protein [Bacillota bacterium]|nr:DUF951 domain-containing protein [Bacillota bacterium]